MSNHRTRGDVMTSLSLSVSADAWQGDPQFIVQVDGKQVGGVQTVSASHAQGQWQTIDLSGDFGTDPSAVKIAFINDSFAGRGMDRNLYVKSLTFDGTVLAGDANRRHVGSNGVAALYSNGSITFDVSHLGGSGAGTTVSDPTPTAPTTPGLSLLGVNLAGAEFGAGHNPGTFGTDYTYPTHQEIDYYASKGMNVIRVPFLWERMQTALNGPLDDAEVGRMKDIVGYAGSKGLKVVLDAHDYGSGFGNLIGSAGTPDSAFADFWGKLSGAFKSDSNVIFGLMNEPNQQSSTSWIASANGAIGAIRASGARQEILVPGSYWDGAWTWTTTDNANVVGKGVVDPLHNYAFEVHQYLDGNGSGTTSDVASTSTGVDRLTSITQWAQQTGAKLFLGEFGAAKDQKSLGALDNMLTYMGDNSKVWQGATYWAGGPWWWGSNIYGAEPDGLGSSTVTDQPQMTVLTHHVATRSA